VEGDVESTHDHNVQPNLVVFKAIQQQHIVTGLVHALLVGLTGEFHAGELVGHQRTKSVIHLEDGENERVRESSREFEREKKK
jgi:hypothetical protein